MQNIWAPSKRCAGICRNLRGIYSKRVKDPRRALVLLIVVQYRLRRRRLVGHLES